MLKRRLIAVIIVREGRVVQSVRFKHTNAIHSDPIHALESFNKWSVDEIVLLNVSPDPTSSTEMLKLVDRISRSCFLPLSIGGWITTEEYGRALLNAGADKLVVNTIFHSDPNTAQKLSERFGQQCVVASIDVARTDQGARIAVNRGQQIVDYTPADWSNRCVELGAGEIFFNSIEHDGARRGYNIAELTNVANAVTVPVIAFGGVMMWSHLKQGLEAGADAVAAANIFHYKEQATRAAKSYLAEAGFPVRVEGQKL